MTAKNITANSEEAKTVLRLVAELPEMAGTIKVHNPNQLHRQLIELHNSLKTLAAAALSVLEDEPPVMTVIKRQAY
jgi:prephenate dehydrogenase